MSGPSAEMIELFLQEASEHLQFLREYSGILQDPYPLDEDIERLYISAHGVAGTGGTYGYAQFQEVASKLAHIFQYAMNATISPDASGPLVEFIYEGIAVLESDLIMISANGIEAGDEIAAFKKRYPFAFRPAPAEAAIESASVGEVKARVAPAEKTPVPARRPQRPARLEESAATIAPDAAVLESSAESVETQAEPVEPREKESAVAESAEVSDRVAAEPNVEPSASAMPVAEEVATTVAPSANDASAAVVPGEEQSWASATEAAASRADGSEPDWRAVPELAADLPLPDEVLEFFVPEVEEHLQVITSCLLSLETRPSADDINRLFRALHTIKGASAQVGWQRISTIAHRAEDLIGRLRDGELSPSGTIIDLCLEAVDVIKKLVYRQWSVEEEFQRTARMLLARLNRVAPPESDELVEEISAPAEAAAVEVDTTSPIAEWSSPAAAKIEMPAAVSETSAPVGEAGPSAATSQTVAEVLSDEPLAALVNEANAVASEPSASPTVAPGAPVGMAQSKSVRIALERLDRMMNAVGELVINRTRMVGRIAELEALAEVLNFSQGRMIEKVSEFQDKYEFSRIGSTPLLPANFLSVPDAWEREASLRGWAGVPMYERPRAVEHVMPEFSELEMDRYDDFGILSRSLTEISADISEVLSQLDGFVRRVDGDIDEFTKLAHRLQDEITQARMVPIGNLFTRIARTVRDAAKASRKQVELNLGGAETELDNNIIQQVADPLLHLVRNAVAHGIETAEERYEQGKPDAGNIAVRAYQKGSHIYVEVEDDGRGIDFARVRTTAVEQGIATREEVDAMPQRELLELLYRPGFSTATRRSELAGRGVGLDVVRANIRNLNGEVAIETESGIGTRFTLKVPLTLIISQALFVRCGAQAFAFPLGFVEEIRRVRPEEIEEVGGKLVTKVRDVVTEVVRLDEALQLKPLEAAHGWLQLVLVNVGGRLVGVVVEEVLRKDEIVIKNLGGYLHNVKLFPGATIAPDGSLILLVDINRLVLGESTERRPLAALLNVSRIFAPGASAVAHGEIPAAAIEPVVREKVVVLADDSISVRKFVGRMLEKAGYRVKLASDGLEALEIATSNLCDLVITDLEMPRTNGYELMMHLRQTPATAKMPVMVVTSRAGAKHRDHALKEGAVAFLVKPVQEESFLAKVAELIGPAGQAAPLAAQEEKTR